MATWTLPDDFVGDTALLADDLNILQEDIRTLKFPNTVYVNSWAQETFPDETQYTAKSELDNLSFVSQGGKCFVCLLVQATTNGNGTDIIGRIVIDGTNYNFRKGAEATPASQAFAIYMWLDIGAGTHTVSVEFIADGASTLTIYATDTRNGLFFIREMT